MQKSESIAKLSAALAKAQGQMRHAAKDKDNPFFHSRYADLAGVIDAMRAPFSENELAVTQGVSSSPGFVVVATMLSHSSGEWISSELQLPTHKYTKAGEIDEQHDAQGVGSAITYARRYALAAMCGVAQDDDDGNAASRRHVTQQQPVAPSPDAAEIGALREKIRAGFEVLGEKNQASYIRDVNDGKIPSTVDGWRYVLSRVEQDIAEMKERKNEK